ncbi:IS4 family transposase [Haloferula sp.]|uniref:IS4 family transposase n=1 Tax=Haloferula sp. TaxID=2497595 RepID=UPI003C7759EC
MCRVKEKIDEKKLRSWKLLDDFRQRLAKARATMPPPPNQRPGGPKPLLLEEDYFSLMLFGLFNPVPESMRGLCSASRLKRVEQDVCGRQVSLGSFSEAQGVFDPELLRQVFLDLSGEIHTSWGDARLAHLADKLKLVDGTLLPALPRMHWALWLNDDNRAAKLHLRFSVLRQAPSDALVTTGNSCERKALRQFVNKGETIVGDRHYGLEYGFLDELRGQGVSFVLRIRNKPRMEIVEELPLTDADRTAGVTWQGMVKLGDKWQGEAIRVVKVEVDGKELLLATDLEIEAELIALIYRYRWQIELFFKWLKSILGCRHLMAESPEGVAIEIYSALIAALMLQLLTGKRPGKRAMELIGFYLMGHADLDEVIALLGLGKSAK